MSIKKIAIIAATAMAAATTAQASDWNERFDLCVEAAEAEGLIDLNEYEPEFDRASARRISLAFSPVSEGDVVNVECKIARGRVVEVNVDS